MPDPAALDDERIREVLQSIDVGVAVVAADDWQVAFENARFFGWFPPEVDAGGDTLADRIPDLKLDRAAQRIEGGRPFEQEVEIKQGPREVPLRLSFSALPGEEGTGGLVLVQVQDITKQREGQYLLESYSKMAERNARELEKEKDRVERLLLNIMPRPVFEEMRDYGTATPQHFESASIVMLDFVGFTDMAISQDPSGLVSELNDIFSAFDRIVEMSGCERLRTIGDAYMAVSGIPETNPDHAENAALAALRMRRYLEKRNQAHPQQWRARIGLNTGEVIGSLVGVQKYVYDLFGPAVNLAARMEALSEPMRITVNADTAALLREKFSLSERGEHEVKGFGTQTLFFLDGEFGNRL